MTETTKVFTLAEVQEMIEKAPMVEIPIEKLLFDSKRYSRQKVDDGAVEDYSHNLLTMPPIIVSPAHLGLSDKNGLTKLKRENTMINCLIQQKCTNQEMNQQSICRHRFSHKKKRPE